MKIGCHQVFTLVFLSHRINTLEEHSKYLPAPAKNKDEMLHFVVLRHKLTVLIQMKEMFLENYMKFAEILKRMIHYQVKRIYFCNNDQLGLKEKTYENVPIKLSLFNNPWKFLWRLPVMTQELLFDPYDGVFVRSQIFFKNILLGRICEPESGQFIIDSERKSISLTFVESPALYFNVSFEKFLLEPHPWCFDTSQNYIKS